MKTTPMLMIAQKIIISISGAIDCAKSFSENKMILGIKVMAVKKARLNNPAPAIKTVKHLFVP